MLFLVSYDLSLISLILLIIMFIVTRIKKDVFSFSSSLFSWIIIINGIALTIEPLTWYLDGKTGTQLYAITYLTNVLLILASPVLIGLWASYLDYKLFKNKKRVIKAHFYQWPTYIIFLLLMLNLRLDIFFSIDPVTNIYTQGQFHIVRYILIYIIFGRLIQLIIFNKDIEDTQAVKGILLFMAFPALGSIIQYIQPDALFTFPFLSLAVVIVYIFLETTSGTLDHLTKLYSRNTLESYINMLIEQQKEFYVVMIDLDNFKAINDVYGHQVGDQVLKDFSYLLKTCQACDNTFAGRLGGDEFLVVLTKHGEKEVHQYVSTLKEFMKETRFYKQFPDLDFSYGTVLSSTKMTLDDILMTVDRNMYVEKNVKKDKN